MPRRDDEKRVHERQMAANGTGNSVLIGRLRSTNGVLKCACQINDNLHDGPTYNPRIKAGCPVMASTSTQYRAGEFLRNPKLCASNEAKRSRRVPTMSGVISLDEISGTDDGSTDSENDDDAFSELRDVCEPIGADVEHAIEAAKNDDGAPEEKLIETAREIYDDDELWVFLETYRSMNGPRRILENYMRGHEKEFTGFADAFWGDTSDPDEGTYNYVQQQVRGHDSTANLYFYKCLFPEPDAEHFPGEPAVWEERPDDDSHIYVTREWMDTYSDYTLEINGKERPFPPWDAIAGEAGDGDNNTEPGGDVLDPREMTVDDIKDALDERDLSMDELKQLKEAESATENRVTALQAIRRAIADIRTGESEPDETDDGTESGESPEAIAGKVLSRLSDENEAAHPEVVMAMARDGKNAEEIVNILS